MKPIQEKINALIKETFFWEREGAWVGLFFLMLIWFTVKDLNIANRKPLNHRHLNNWVVICCFLVEYVTKIVIKYLLSGEIFI